MKDETQPKLPLPRGWFYATPAESLSLWNELQAELPGGHVLFGKQVKVIAHRRGGTDDILCVYEDEPSRYTVVHLTWALHPEINVNFPSIEMDGTYSDFLDYEKGFGAD